MAAKHIVIFFSICFIFSYAQASNNLHNSILKNEESAPIEITLTPTNELKSSTEKYIIFNIPFPPSYITEPENITLTTSTGEELYFFPEIVSNWRFIKNTKPSSIRSLKIYLKNDKNRIYPLKIQARKIFSPKYILTAKPNIDNLINTEKISLEFENGAQIINISEPKYYATYRPNWLSACLFRTKTLDIKKSNKLAWFDQASIDFSETISTALSSDNLTFQEVNLTKHRAWQYDLAATLYNSYIKTGELEWLRLAHKATQIYAHFINSEGVWTLKNKPDIKFSYNLSMFIDYLLIGDSSLLPKIDAVADFVSNWKYDYKRTYGFWTERHQTYSLLGAIIAWEATGKPAHAERAIIVAKATIQETLNPEPPWKAVGCLQHEFGAHDRDEGGESKIPVCSPWMSALLADAMLRYFIQSGDSKALEILYNFAGFIINHGIYITDNRKIKGYTLPRYFAFPEKDIIKDGAAYNDAQHACDVAALLGKGLWAGKLLSKNTTRIKDTIDKLMLPCKNHIERNLRKAKGTEIVYMRVKPPRKYSWLFGTTSDLSYFYHFK